jgi:hypothetical protein
LKRLLLALAIFLIPAMVFAQLDTSNIGNTITELEEPLTDFAGSFANSLPTNAAIGLTWSDAYIGQLLRVPPNLGIGLTVGASTIDYGSLETFFGELGESVPQEVQEVGEQFGIPLPGAVIDARIGGIILPFDFGVKVGFVPGVARQAIRDNVPGLEFDYLLAGFDVRVPVLQEGVLLPEVSVGGGYNYLNGSIGLDGILGSDIPVGDVTLPDESTQSISLADPSVFFDWNASTIDLKAQASKKLLFLRPYIGLGATYARAGVGTGVRSQVQGVDDLQATIESLQEQAADLGLPTSAEFDQYDDLAGDTGLAIGVNEGANGWGFRAFGGLGFDIFILKIDLGLMYNLVDGSWGGTVGTRIQL